MPFLRSVSPQIDQARGRGAGGGTEIGPILDPISVLPHACFYYPNEDVARKLDKDWVNYSIHDHPHTPNHRVDAPPQGPDGP